MQFTQQIDSPRGGRPTPEHDGDPQPRGSRAPTIAVIGSTGLLGRSAVQTFLDQGHRVLACARGRQDDLPPGAQSRVLDVTEPAGIAPALVGADAVHISLSGGSHPATIHAVEEDGIGHILRAAHELGIRRVTMISGMYACPEFERHSGEAAKLRAEQEMMSSPVPTTIFRAGFIAESLERFVQGDRAVLLGRQPHVIRPIVAADLMRSVARSCTMPETENRVFDVTGLEEMTLRTALRRYLDAVHPGMPLTTLPLPVMRAVNRLALHGELSRTLGTMRLLQTHGEVADSTDYFRVFGTGTTCFDDWLALQRDRRAQPPSTSTAGRTAG